MSLREQLRDILPKILPSNPTEAIKGTELIRLVRFRLGDEYSDATLRYHFSILSYDPTSPIAKVDQGQGYYMRQSTSEGGTDLYRQASFANGDDPGDLQRSRMDRFRAIVERHSLHASRYPFLLGQSPLGDWELPDVVITDWDFETDNDEAPRLDAPMMNLKRHLGVSTVTLTAAQLKLKVTLESCAADFFQTVSATRWANLGEIFIAESVRDEALVDNLRKLGHQYGIGITSFGVDLTLLDEMPSPADIRNLTAAEFESLQTLLRVQRLSVGTHRSHVDWNHLSNLRKKHDSITRMITWLNDCLDSQQPVWQRDA